MAAQSTFPFGNVTNWVCDPVFVFSDLDLIFDDCYSCFFNLPFVFSDLSSFLCLFLSLWLASVPMFSLCLSCLMSSHPCAYVPSVPESVMSLSLCLYIGIMLPVLL